MAEKFSYSKLDTFQQCPYRFKKKYEEKLYSTGTTLALELGTIAHKGMELVTRALLRDEKPDYEGIKQLTYDGCPDVDAKGKSINLRGFKELKEQYFFDWVQPDDKSGMNYDQKLALYFACLKSQENDPMWKPMACEHRFCVDVQGYMMTGSVDRIDSNEAGELRIVDYKTSKKIFDDKDIKTALQMVVYDYAAIAGFDRVPVEHMYDFVFIGQTQLACSKGYFTRGEKKLAQLFSSLNDCRLSQIYTPKPSPLCYWCDYSATNPNAEFSLKNQCSYHSLWTPTNKVYTANQEFKAGAPEKASPTETAAKTFWF